MKIDALLKAYQEKIEHALEQCLPKASLEPSRLHSAMRYAVLGGGKRIRAALLYATGDALGVDINRLDPIACALECIHAYSLVHDDLPAMDDDDLRRGQPSCHKAFDEATAILVGDALQSLAFECLCDQETLQVTAEQQLRLVLQLSQAIGSRGMAGGQALDLAFTGTPANAEQLEQIHTLKTGALLACSVLMAATVADTNNQAPLQTYAQAIGLAFQIQDDILDVTASTEQLGKRQGADIAEQKSTFVSLYGLAGAKEQLKNQHQIALSALDELDADVTQLKQLANYLHQRQY